MTAEIAEHQALIRSIVGAIVNYPENVEVQPQESLDYLAWIVRVHPSDEGMAIGIGGHHVRAVARLMDEFGRAVGRKYELQLRTPGLRRRFEPKHPIALKYDPEPVRMLLSQVMENLEIGGYAIDVRQTATKPPLGFIFTLTVENDNDHHSLTTLTNGSSIEGAIGAIFLAVAKKSGVEFQVNVAKPVH